MQTDPNLANYRFDPASNRIILLDFGAVMPVLPEQVQDFRQLLNAALDGDPTTTHAAMLKIGYFNPATAPRHQTLIQQMFDTAMAPLRQTTPFDFGSAGLIETLRTMGLAIGSERDLTHVPPPCSCTARSAASTCLPRNCKPASPCAPWSSVIADGDSITPSVAAKPGLAFNSGKLIAKFPTCDTAAVLDENAAASHCKLDANQNRAISPLQSRPSVSGAICAVRTGATIMGKVLIWGGSGGIGAATARALAANGFALHLVGRDGDRLAALAAELDAGTTQADVSDDAAFDRVMAEVEGPLAGLVYAVGTINLRPLARLTATDFARDFRLNAAGAALAVQAALPALKAAPSGASVVLFSTVAVAQGFAAHASVSMAKGAVEGLTRALGAELAPKIRVNAIAPSLTDTPLAAGFAANPQMVTSIAQMHAMQRIGTPKDIAALAAFLISDQADWISGQVIAVDGGRSRLRVKG